LAIVDSSFRVLLDTACRPAAAVTDYRTYATELDSAKLDAAPDFAEVRREASRLLEGKVVVGVAVSQMLRWLGVKVPQKRQRDLQISGYMIVGEPPGGHTVQKSLGELYREVYGEELEGGGRDAAVRAVGAMRLYLRGRIGWERGASRYRHLRAKEDAATAAATTEAARATAGEAE